MTKIPRKVLLVISMAIIIFHAVGIQASSFNYHQEDHRDRQRWAEGFNWLQKNTETDDVVFASFDISRTLPIYTHNYPYGALHASSFPVSLERLKHNYFIRMQVMGLEADDAREYFFDPTHRDELGQYIFEGQYYRALCGSFGCFSDEILEDILSEYVEFSGSSFEENLSKYRADYVFWDGKRDEGWNLDQYSFLQRVFESGQAVIYELE